MCRPIDRNTRMFLSFSSCVISFSSRRNRFRLLKFAGITARPVPPILNSFNWFVNVSVNLVKQKMHWNQQWWSMSAKMYAFLHLRSSSSDYISFLQQDRHLQSSDEQTQQPSSLVELETLELQKPQVWTNCLSLITWLICCLSRMKSIIQVKNV